MLREISTPIDRLADAVPLIEDLRDTLHEFQRTHGFGRGISGVQIAFPKRVIYLEFEYREYCLINPAFEWMSSERFALWDDCFSFPGLLVHLERSESVRLKYLDKAGVPRQIDAEGSLAELIQHEMDHLDGILAVDRAMGRDGLCTRDEFARRRQQAAEGNRNTLASRAR